VPSIVTSALIEKAVYWRVVKDGFVDQGPATDPVEINCRWIAGFEDREKVASASVLVDRDVDTGGYIRLGPISDLIPANTNENYPPESPAALLNPLAHWAFEGDLTNEVISGPAFSVLVGSPSFITGAYGQGLDHNTANFTIETTAAVNLLASTSATLSLYAILGRHDAADNPRIDISFAGVSMALLYDGIEANGYEYPLPAGWAEVGFRGVAFELVEGAAPRVFVTGAELVPTVTGSLVPPLVDDVLSFDTTLGDHVDHGHGSLDEVLVYRGTLDKKSLQVLAAAHPLYYEDVEEIVQFQAANSINGKLRVRRGWLKK
jgi:hypothetical protein